ncbi:Pyruvate dehydrogenase kinase, partial [Penicillium coprophilum]|uniref:Pyruvate dehydrogenase kinase n=1 Tax=Penicillium coprophilum TaxID=36646 RepID=UPI002382FF00
IGVLTGVTCLAHRPATPNISSSNYAGAHDSEHLYGLDTSWMSAWSTMRLSYSARSGQILKSPSRRLYSGGHSPPPWRPVSAVDEWVERAIRPISLRQLTFFGRTLTEPRLISSANYVRTELPTRLAHRLRDIQQLPYVVVANPHLTLVYELYYKAFERVRVVPEIRTLEDNDHFCEILKEMLREHLVAIPNLAIGVLECRHLAPADEMDRLMNTLLRARISRRVIAEQHLALTETFNSPWHFPDSHDRTDMNADFVGEVFLKCKAKEVVERCGKVAQDLMRKISGSTQIPAITVKGHCDATFPYILSHLEYIIGELLRNSVQAVMEKYQHSTEPPPPIEVLVCETPQHVILRVSDQGGGIPREILPYLWSFSKGPRTQTRLENLGRVPAMAATMQDLQESQELRHINRDVYHEGSLDTLTSRPPDLRLGMGLPMSRVYAEYWAGSLELHSLEGYGVDAFLQISKLGNKNEQVTTRAAIDAV